MRIDRVSVCAWAGLALVSSCGSEGGASGSGGTDSSAGSGSHTGAETGAVFRVPVVVHVIDAGSAVGVGANISFAQIQSQIEVLNEDFRRMPGTNGFGNEGTAVDAEIEFYLAELGPDGAILEEPGVDRSDGGRSSWPKGRLLNPIGSLIKPSTYWPPEDYFNIWTVNFGGFVSRNLLGYAQFPSESGLPGLNDDGGEAQTDGIVLGYKYFGSSEKGEFPELIAPYDLGRTTTHEVGHWLGLRHIWRDGECGVDDFCADTPTAQEPNYECVQHVSCGSNDMIENYMDYTVDACVNTSTADQRDRMHTVLTTSSATARAHRIAARYVVNGVRGRR